MRPHRHSTRQARGRVSSRWPCPQVVWCRVCPLGLPGRCPPVLVVCAAAEVQNLVNRLGALSSASGVYLVRPPVPARPWARARHRRYARWPRDGCWRGSGLLGCVDALGVFGGRVWSCSSSSWCVLYGGVERPPIQDTHVI